MVANPVRFSVGVSEEGGRKTSMGDKRRRYRKLHF